ncbi:MAG: hypothetical protein KAR06_05640, partial [Deltaproteobacteria bacterium]|nr:hypothetical protein [Deltaproteobacteria bacterium]
MWEKELAHNLAQAKPADRKSIIADYIQKTGKSKPSLYRIAKKHGFDAGRSRRSDKGELKCGLTDQCIDYIAALRHTTRRENKGIIMPVERALQIAVDNGIIEEGQVSVASLNRILRDRQMSREHLEAPGVHTQMRSLYPNHTHV